MSTPSTPPESPLDCEQPPSSETGETRIRIRRRSGSPGAPNTKGGKEVARQNFSMHPDLIKAILQASAELSKERATAIVDDRAKRVTYSKVVAALAWVLKTCYLTPEGDITPAFRRLIAEYEATRFERPNDTHRADEIMEMRRRYAAFLAGQEGEPQEFSTAHLPFLDDEETRDG